MTSGRSADTTSGRDAESCGRGDGSGDSAAPHRVSSWAVERGRVAYLGLAVQTDSALFVGPTGGNDLWRRSAAQRDEGSPPWLPIYRDGMTVRFVSGSGDLDRPAGPGKGRAWFPVAPTQ